mmetsp:Transcript_96533/g.275359  ORF Transcript_96533/g.275359 Transcript_96533/m.275359 type:complete len:222 (-) Transcript_96533:98-763(-)
MGHCIGTLEQHTDAVQVLIECGTFVISGSNDGSIKIWDSVHWVCLKTIRSCSGSIKALCCVQNELNGLKLVYGGYDRKVRVWNTDGWVCEHVLHGHQSGVTALCVYANGNNFASTSNDDTVRLWDASTWECLSTLYGHTETVWTICEVDRWLISGSGDGTLRVWDPDTGECEAVVQANEQPVSTLLAVDGGGLGNDKGLVSGSWDSSIAFWGLVEADRADQ